MHSTCIHMCKCMSLCLEAMSTVCTCATCVLYVSMVAIVLIYDNIKLFVFVHIWVYTWIYITGFLGVLYVYIECAHLCVWMELYSALTGLCILPG